MGRYRIREVCGGRYKRKAGHRRVNELLKMLRKHGIERITVTERLVEHARQTQDFGWMWKAEPEDTYFEVTWKEGSDDVHGTTET